MASLTALPTELLIQIASYLDKDDLCAVRKSSKRLAATASYTLFHTIRLYPSPKSIEKYYAFLESPELNKAVRHVYLNTIDGNALLATPDAATGYIPRPYDPSVLHPDAPVIRTSPLRWSHLFAHLLTHAAPHHLRTFRIGSSGLGGWHHRSATHPADNDNNNNDDDDNNNDDANDPSHPRVYANLPLALQPDRYLICHMGIGPSWYTDLGTLAWPALFEPEDGAGTRAGDETERFIDALEAGDVDAEDREALVALLRGIGQVREGEEEGVEVGGMLGRAWGWRDAAVYGSIGPRDPDAWP
ncbi:hypothetical protein SLS54_004917 [Diplodia seriata]